MSSLRNAVKRVTHKERSQPAARRRLGLLEKHSDYVVRAKDHNKKRDYLNKLRLKAALKNPDEFYFGMHKSKVKEGVHQLPDEPELDKETLLVLKTQDLAYVNMESAKNEKKVEKLRANLHMLGSKPINKHTIFVDSIQEKNNFDASKHFDTAPELVDRAFNRPRLSTLKTKPIVGASNRREMKKIIQKRAKAYKELDNRQTRASKLSVAAAHLATKRALMRSSKKVVQKVQPATGTAPAVYKWKRQRAK